MRRIVVDECTYEYILEKSRKDAKSIAYTVSFILDIYKLTVSQIAEDPKKMPYRTCRRAFYEHCKLTMDQTTINFCEAKKEYMDHWLKQHKEEFDCFKVIYKAQKKEKKKESRKEYMHYYYLKNRDPKHVQS